MKYPNLSEEKKLWKKGFRFVAGLDEAGRGALCGPVVAAAVVLKLKIKNFGVRDSKKLSAKQRDKFYKILTKHPQIKWGVGIVSEKAIDKINILQATKLAMKKAVKNLGKKLKKIGESLSPNSYDRRNLGIMDFLILDGNFKLDTAILQKSIVRADEKVFSCAAASIIAKVTRDRIMQKYHKKYPHYGFSIHKGYPTKTHYKMLKKYGHCKIHRKSFRLLH